MQRPFASVRKPDFLPRIKYQQMVLDFFLRVKGLLGLETNRKIGEKLVVFCRALCASQVENCSAIYRNRFERSGRKGTVRKGEKEGRRNGIAVPPNLAEQFASEARTRVFFLHRGKTGKNLLSKAKSNLSLPDMRRISFKADEQWKVMHFRSPLC